MTALASESLQQKDNLCGPFQAARVLRELGYEADEDAIASRAGSLLPEPDAGSVPPGAESRTEYRYDLGRAAPNESGTAPGPLASAIEAASAGELRCVPIAGSWTPERVELLVAEGTQTARLLANVRTGHLWGTRPTFDALAAELNGNAAEGPPPEWDVGHFVELAGLVRGTGGSLVAIRDSYPSFGLAGHHLQPPRAVAAALSRGDGREGGIHAVSRVAQAGEIEKLARGLGLELRIWDNGTRR